MQVTVLMKLHQLQYFGESQIPFKVHDCIVFDKKKLSKLYARIQQLYEETLELHVKHKYVNFAHGESINNITNIEDPHERNIHVMFAEMLEHIFTELNSIVIKCVSTIKNCKMR